MQLNLTASRLETRFFSDTPNQNELGVSEPKPLLTQYVQPYTGARIPEIIPLVLGKPIFINGFHQPTNGRSGCGEFEFCLVSINRLTGKRNRLSSFEHKRLVIDSAAFARESGFFPQFDGHLPAEEYAAHLRKWAGLTNLLAGVTQDYMCEKAVLELNNTTVAQQQQKTIARYDELLLLLEDSGIYLMPVLQGYEPEEYVQCIKLYGDRLLPGMWVGVGSVCKRNGNPRAILEVLQAIKGERPDLQLHGFGLKKEALGVPEIQELLFSADSAAAGLSKGRSSEKYKGSNDPITNLEYEKLIYESYLRTSNTQEQEQACYQAIARINASITRIKKRGNNYQDFKEPSGTLYNFYRDKERKVQTTQYRFKVKVSGKWKTISYHVSPDQLPLVESAINSKKGSHHIVTQIFKKTWEWG
ncbi:hypothetical protein G7B40_031045 [Aetokthonos hydrillicola Thurmond2011]|jgi:hypothetical protein|uniref:DeoxyPurine in DNA protein A domain-containing protein n=1 Tax=Aetokthonos hydrillicola Thurmond2011 TaxID=2712845 RepID=A0AAP5IF37_9CYAN|nr:hypothetical protein [Aetokthonos hydrillicola]MBO3462114.1 hypothetical protein [Aetokthonos hydrillicola CCALA 1050]MBW4589708.1 hypothetical protein [Aetokthonos hydrillicola CCALA 1050]MDR9898962.1 hypothetical protein [Aetokthonos hydrillicola Thurmond2011]